MARREEVRPKVDTSPEAPVARGFSVDAKIEAIKSSRLPESQKGAYIAALSGSKEDVEAVTLDVYLRVKKKSESVKAGMKAFPKAKAIARATVAEWDSVFANY